MQLHVVDFAQDRVIYNATGCTQEELDNKLNHFFSSEGYKPKSSTAETKTFEKGNRVLRILFGAFVKYHKQSVMIKEEGGLFSVMLHRDSSGMSGGLIGMRQVKKEFERLTEAFRAYFSQ